MENFSADAPPPPPPVLEAKELSNDVQYDEHAVIKIGSAGQTLIIDNATYGSTGNPKPLDGEFRDASHLRVRFRPLDSN